MSELTGAVKEGLLALAVGAGLQVMQVMMEANVTAVCGPKGRHVPDRAAVRHGSEDGAVVLGGRKVRVRPPRVRTADLATCISQRSAPRSTRTRHAAVTPACENEQAA